MNSAVNLLNEVIATFDWSERVYFTVSESIGFLCDNDEIIIGQVSIQKSNKIFVRFDSDRMTRYHFGHPYHWIHLPSDRICHPLAVHQYRRPRSQSTGKCPSHPPIFQPSACFDQTLFNAVQTQSCIIHVSNSITVNYNNCAAIKRLCESVKWYSSLDIINNQNQQHLFEEFVTEVYYRLIDDYAHLIQCHDHELHEIYQMISAQPQFTKCQISKCKFSRRHLRSDHDEVDEHSLLDSNLRFYAEMMDSLHFYLFHLFDTALRTSHIGIEARDRHRDTSVSMIMQNIQQKKHITAQLAHLSSNNKFSIAIAAHLHKENYTFMDEMLQYLCQNGLSIDTVRILKKFYDDEEYETECIIYEFDNNTSCNSCLIQNDDCILLIKRFIEAKMQLISSFNVGFKYYYWPYYKTLTQIPEEHNIPNNINDHSGYHVCDLFIEKKYNNLKEEIANYTYLSWSTFINSVITKAKYYFNTQMVRQLKAVKQDLFVLRYDIPSGKEFGFENLLCLILYTDCSDLSCHFSATFRPLSLFETISSVKARHRMYYWWGRILRETVELFGNRGRGDEHANSGRCVRRMTGPFYTGMSRVMPMPQVNIRLCGPVSTSLYKEVAVNFSGSDGMVIQFNNDVWPNDLVRGFDCSWISRYKGEHESLWFGGLVSLNIESVILKRSKINFYVFFRALSHLDCMLSGCKLYAKRTIVPAVLKPLFEWKLRGIVDVNVNEYKYDTFKCFCCSKRQIVIDLSLLPKANKVMLKLVIGPSGITTEPIDIFDETDARNLFCLDLLGLFENVNVVIIDTSKRYSLSLRMLLLTLSRVSLDKVIIKANGKDNWIRSSWSSSSEKIKSLYSERNYDIRHNNVSTTCGNEDWLTITRL